jgi:hypothetical protein
MVTVSEDRPAGYQFTARLDHRLGHSDTLGASLFLYRNRSTSQNTATIGANSDGLDRGHNLSVQHVHNFSTQMTNSFTFGHSVWHPVSASYGKFREVDLILEGYNIHNLSEGPRGFPYISTNSNNFSAQGYAYKEEVTNVQWKDDFSKLLHSHNLKIGGDMRLAPDREFSSCGYPAFTFSRYNTSGTGNDLADLLLGIPASYSQASDCQAHFSRMFAAVYAQDDIRLRRSLALNLGLRYEWNGALKELDNHNAVFRPGSRSSVFPNAPAGVLFSGDFDPLSGHRLGNQLMPADATSLAPRLGIAWSPGFQGRLAQHLFGGPGRTSLRAGYGIYNTTGIADVGFIMQRFPPWSIYITRDRSILDASGGNMLNPWGTDSDPFAGSLEQRQFNLPLSGVPYVEPGFRYPYQYQWSMSLQRQFAGGLTLEIAYLGNRALHLTRGFQANPALVTADANVSNAASRRTYKDLDSVTGYSSDGTSIYHCLQATVSRRFSSRLLLEFHYHWSKTLDNSGNIGLGQGGDRATTAWGRANFDRRHNFVGYWVVDLPGPHRPWLLRHAFSGWRLSGNLQLRTGIPLEIRNPYDSTLRGGLSPNMPDIVGPFRSFDPREVRTFKLPNGRTMTGNFLFNPTVFRIVNPATPEDARIGNLGRNVFSGPGTANVDLGLCKEFRLKERRRFEVRIEAANAFNHAQFIARSANSTNTANANFGRVVGTSGPRRIQFRLAYSF